MTARLDVAAVMSVDDGEVIATMSGHEGELFTAASGPAGERIATGGLDATTRIWDAATGDTHVVLHGHDDATIGVAFSPDARGDRQC